MERSRPDPEELGNIPAKAGPLFSQNTEKEGRCTTIYHLPLPQSGGPSDKKKKSYPALIYCVMGINAQRGLELAAGRRICAQRDGLNQLFLVLVTSREIPLFR